jgi:hypothetical protein
MNLFLFQDGFKGGIARCVPDIGVSVVEAFCKTKSDVGILFQFQ